MSRFRNPVMRNNYDAMVNKYQLRHSDLFTAELIPHMGAGGGQAFWLGYQGKTMGRGFVGKDKQTMAYAYWRAGQDCRANEGDNPLFSGTYTGDNCLRLNHLQNQQ